MIRRLAVGGMGEIFLARQAIAGVNRLVVLKRLLPGLAEDAELLAMFIDEARIAANLAHPGIVQVHEFGEDAEGYFIVMEYVPGHHVGQLLVRSQRDHKPIATRIGAFIVHEVARALDHAHHARDSEGAPLEIVHRDISPSNVLVSFRGDVKLMDFGVARAANRAHRTSDGTIRGKFAYMAPEQFESKDVGTHSDVFAAGILLWELTLARRLFTGASDFETIRAALEQPIPRPTSIDPYYPPALEELVMSALERDPARRLASAAELATGLKAYLRANPADRDDLAALMSELFPDDAAESVRLVEEHTRPNTVPTVILPVHDAVPPVAPRRRWLLLLFALLALGGLGVAIVMIVNNPEHPEPARPLVATTPDAPAKIAAHTDSAPNVEPDVEPIAVRLPDAAPPVIRKPPSPDAAVKVPIDASLDAAPIEYGDLTLDLKPDEKRRVEGSVFYSGLHCTTESALPTRCLHLPVGSSHELTFKVSGGAAFKATLRVKPGTTRCWVYPSRSAVEC